MLIKIRNNNDILRFQEYIQEFETMYVEMFPLSDEREDFQDILTRVSENILPHTFINLFIQDNKTVGGIVLDYYPECNSIEPIYLLVHEDYRCKGIGSQLLATCYDEMLCVEHVFLECDNPELVSKDCSVMDPEVRLNMYLKMGFTIVPITYVQPPLSLEKEYERNLLLLYKGSNLSSDVLINFLTYFYKYLGYIDSNELERMIEQIKSSFNS